MIFYSVAILVIVCVSSGYSEKINGLPPYIKACPLNDPNFDQCCLDHGRAAIPHLAKGDKKYGIPNFDPLELQSISIDTGSNLTFGLTDLKIYGVDNVELRNIKFNIETKTVNFDLYLEQIDIIGNYNIDGKILLLWIQGNGPANLSASGGEIFYNFTYSLIQKNGEEYLVSDENQCDFNFKNIHVHLENLFNGNEQLGKTTNQVINVEWRSLLDELKPAITKAIITIAKSIIDNITRKVPYKYVFL